MAFRRTDLTLLALLSLLFLVPGFVALGIVLAAALRCGLERHVALAAAAVALPLVWLTQLLSVLLDESSGPLVGRSRILVLDEVTRIWTWDRQQLLAALPVVVVLIVAVELQRRQRRLPSPGTSWVLLALAMAVASVTIHLGQLGGTAIPSDLVLGLFLVAPAVVAAVVVTTGLRSGASREPALSGYSP